MKKKTISLGLVVVMIITTVLSGVVSKDKNVSAAQAPKTLKMPIIIYDHLSDNLLFEYDLNNQFSNNLSLENITELLGQDAGKGLVEDTLGENGRPVYKQKVVEKVASLVKSYMENTYYSNGTDLYKKIYTQITKKQNKKTVATLGDYNSTKAKFDKGAGVDDIKSCMDYAYYRLNNFWCETNNQVSKKTNAYSTLQLDLINNLYRSSNDYEINYDPENKLISQNSNNLLSQEVGFYPLDKNVLKNHSDLTAPFGTEMYNKYDKKNHNYHFSMKAKCQFLYKKSDNLKFKFSGDDDVYLFIDNKLALDIGGAHLKRSEVLNVNEVAKKLGLIDGEVYSFDFFYMERHTTDSNIMIETNMILEQADAKTEVVYKNNGKTLTQYDSLNVGENIDVEYILTAGNDKMGNMKFVDDTLGVTIGKDTLSLNGKDLNVSDKIKVEVKDKNGNVKDSFFIDKQDLTDNKKVKEFLDKFNGVKLNKEDKITVSGISKKINYDSVAQSNLNVEITADLKKYTDNGTIEETPTDIPVTPSTNIVIPRNEIAADFDLKFVDSNGKAFEGNLKRGTKVFEEYNVTAKSDNMKDMTIVDKNGFKITKEGLIIPEGYFVEDSLTFSLVDKNNKEIDKVSISKADLKNGNASAVFEKLYGNNQWIMNNGDSIVISGMYKEMDNSGVEADATATLSGPIPNYDKNNNKLSVEWKKVTLKDRDQLSPLKLLNVKFIADKHGIVRGDVNQEVEYESSVSSVPTPISDKGYEFLGWEKTVSQGVSISENPSSEIILEDTLFTAKFGPLSYNYIVKYVDEEGNPLLPEKHADKKKYGEPVVEMAEEIEGYAVDSNKKEITIDVENNEIVFVYKKKIYNVKFTTDGNGVIDGKKDYKVKYDETVEKTPNEIANEGYTFNGWTKKTKNEEIAVEDPSKEHIKEDTVFIAHYVINEYDYTVRYVDENGNSLINDVTKKAKYNTDVTEEPVEIEGYEKSDKAKTIKIKTKDNLIIFVYKQKEIETPPETTTEEPTTEQPTTEETITEEATTEEPTTEQPTTEEQTTENADEETTSENKITKYVDYQIKKNNYTSDGNGYKAPSSYVSTSTISPKTGYESTWKGIVAGIAMSAVAGAAGVFGVIKKKKYN